MYLYGVQVKTSLKHWSWVKPNGDATEQPVHAAQWERREAALEAMEFLAKHVPSKSFRVCRKPGVCHHV